MANNITYKNLYSLIVEEIEKRNNFATTSGYNTQLTRVGVSPIVDVGRYDASISDMITAIQNLLIEALPAQILSGLVVTATDPISANVEVTAGKGCAGGQLYELAEDTTVGIPFDDTTYIFYITLYKDGILVEKTYTASHLTIAKVVVPQPGTTNVVQDEKDSSWNAYIVNMQEYKLYGYNDKFEEETIELLRNNISPILADNLIGNIRLNEDLKIINTQGTLELNSDSLKLYDIDANLLSKFNRNGVYFYDEDGRELAKFTSTEARVGNIRLLPQSIQSENFVTNTSGFQIQDNGDAEFNNIRLRGTLYTSTIAENIYISPGVTFIGDLNLFESDITLDMGYKLIFDSDNGSDTYWVYNSVTQYLEGWVDGTKRIEL